MKPNILDKNNLIKKKWLTFKINYNICEFLKLISNQYGINDLNEYNENKEAYSGTMLLSTLKNIVAYDTLHGLIIEYKDSIDYMVYFYSYDGAGFIKIEHLHYLQKV